MLKKSFKIGLGFGLTSGVLTTLGLLVGLLTSTYSKTAIIGGILTIALADSLSDSFGIHISEESQKDSSRLHVWSATLYTLFFKVLSSSTFILPFLLFPLVTATLVSVIWGYLLLGAFSLHVANVENEKPSKVLFEHYTIATAIIAFTYVVGTLVSRFI